MFLDLFEMSYMDMKLNKVLYKFFVLEWVHLVEAIKSYDDKLWEKFMMNFYGFQETERWEIDQEIQLQMT